MPTIYFGVVKKFLIHRYRVAMMSDNVKLSRKFLIKFSSVTSTKLWSLNYLKVNFYKNNLEKN